MSSVWGTAAELRQAIREGGLVRDLAIHVGSTESLSAKDGEIGSWKRSLPVFLDLLCNIGLDRVPVILEHKLPYSPRRVDVVVCGVHPDTGQSSYVLVELKQWSVARMVGAGLVKSRTGQKQPDLHPAEQVRRYCRHLIEFTQFLARRPELVKGMAYMHNAYRQSDWNLDEFEFDDFGQLYTADQASDLVADLRSLLDDDPNVESAASRAAIELFSAPHAPARTLMRTVADSVMGRDDFILMDEQQVAFEMVRDAVEEANNVGLHVKENRKKVVVVRGGPGSGKSAIALSLLGKLARNGKSALHATGSKAFTETLREQIAGEVERATRVFTYFNNFGSARQGALDVVICDEAHRVRGNAGIPARLRGKIRGQIDQLIDVAKVPVFLLDENQIVRPDEIGTTVDIVNIARSKGCEVIEVHLDGQFRCGGSPKYDEWVLRLLGLADGAGPVGWSELVEGTDDQYVVDSAVSPQSLESWLLRQANNFSGTARIAAGFCWDWSDPVKRNGQFFLVDDVAIEGWVRPWNTKHNWVVPGAPSASLWASDPRGFGQVGCVYTAQGFEYDWAGVIFGADLVIRDGRWVARRSFSHDKSMKKISDQLFDKLVRNTYKVLLTRGMQGVCVYSTDDETNKFLQMYAR